MPHLTKTTLTGLLAVAAICLSACSKEDVTPKKANHSQAIIGKWNLDSIIVTYKDFNNTEKQTTTFRSNQAVTTHIEFKSDGGFYNTQSDHTTGIETQDYSPSGWALDGDRIKLIGPAPRHTRSERIILNISEQHLTLATAPTAADTLFSRNSPVGIYQQTIHYYYK